MQNAKKLIAGIILSVHVKVHGRYCGFPGRVKIAREKLEQWFWRLLWCHT